MSERVTVTVVVPRQEFTYDYDADDWDHAVENAGVGYLMDLDLSDMDPHYEVYGPTGDRVAVW